MRKWISVAAVVTMVMGFAAVGFAQEAIDTIEGAVSEPVGIVAWLMNPATWALAVPVVASLCAALFSDKPGVMRIVNQLALNFGKAKNDPARQ